MGLGETEESGGANVQVTGQQATGSIGSVVVRISKVVSVTGVQGQGRVGKVLIWSKINPNQNPNWIPVNDVQTPNWLPIAA